MPLRHIAHIIKVPRLVRRFEQRHGDGVNQTEQDKHKYQIPNADFRIEMGCLARKALRAAPVFEILTWTPAHD